MLSEKIAEAFETAPWQPSHYNKATGESKLVDDIPLALANVSHYAMHAEARFSGGGDFEFFSLDAEPLLTIPGDINRITLYVKAEHEGPAYPWAVAFRDGWGRDKVGNKKLEWDLSGKVTGQWQQFRFDVPDDWVRPVSIAGFVTHNWSSKQQPGKARLWVDQIQATTDISNVDPQTGKLNGWTPGPADEKGKVAAQPIVPLLSVTLATPNLHNVFIDSAPALNVRVRSWKPGETSGDLAWRLLDEDGKPIAIGHQPVRVTDFATMTIPLPVSRYGLYTTDVTLTWSDGSIRHDQLPMVMIPTPITLSEQQKFDSPYGLNVHGGRARMVQTFRDAGIVWFRDYAFNFDWMIRAKGEQNKYDGWPWYPQIVKEYDDAGAMVLACHMGAIRQPAPETPAHPEQNAPSAEWEKELAQMVLAFPSIRYHELDNEYDLRHATMESRIDWANYGEYHKAFGDVIRTPGGDHLVAVENGRAGIWPQRVEQMVRAGYFDKIDVVNSHHYTGVDPPETNVVNANTDAAATERPQLFFDQLRDAARAGRIDGKPREHWLTEFGWDTKAGHIVTPRQQAAYLQRGYMLLMAAGVTKGFWFFDMDAPVADHFFDGCGLVDDKQQPKLSYAAYAAMTHLMPTPKFVGIINAGEGTWGYVFRNGEQLVAGLWTIDDVQGPNVRFPGGKLYDYMANPLPADSVTLSMTPVYAVGISTDSPWYRQTAYMLESPYLEACASGDEVTVELKVTNNRTTPISGRADMQLPTGWVIEQQAVTFLVEPGKTQIVPMHFIIDPNEPLGEKYIAVNISEGSERIKRIPLRVRVQPAMSISATALSGSPGTSQVQVTLHNHSLSTAIGGKLQLTLPSSWSTPQQQITIEPIAPGQQRRLSVSVTWSEAWRPDESAAIRFSSGKGQQISTSLIPGRMVIHLANHITIDGDLRDWRPNQQLPDWILGCTSGPAQAKIYMAWADTGLYLAADVHDSQLRVTSPKDFWLGDVLELFIDTHNRKTHRRFGPGDHQFWFVPQPQAERVFAGQWKRGDELPATRYDIPEIQSASRRTDDGYVMELFIPASQMVGYQPREGEQIGLNVNLSVIGRSLNREVFWPGGKSDATASDPSVWGTVKLEP